MVISCVLQDSRFEVSKNGTLRINSVEVYDGTWYRCVSSTPAGSIEAQARVQVLGELARGGRAPCLMGRRVNGEGAAGFTVFRLVPSLFSCLSSSFPPTHSPSTETEKLKFTPPPRPQQCMEFDKEATVPCSATGREKPTIKWIRAGGYHVGLGRRIGKAIHWSDAWICKNQLSALHHARNCGERLKI